MRTSSRAVRFLVVGLGLASAFAPLGNEAPALAGTGKGPGAAVALGEALFHRKWIPDDVRCHDGDGLGPVYNDVSCLACHNQGGPGGGGSKQKDVVLLNFFAPQSQDPSPFRLAETARLIREQTGFRTTGTVVLHKFGTAPRFAAWREALLQESFEGFTMTRTSRNTPALFGSGLIDAVPDAVIEAQAKRTFARFPAVQGRVSRLKGGRIGRFGWKGQTPSLYDFVLTACSVELGLEVPGHHQSDDPSTPSRKGSELDLSPGECASLVAYVASLPAPIEVAPPRLEEARKVLEGGAVFKQVGCNACHTPMLGEVDGIYSDLLLHDMGPGDGDSGFYYSPGESLSDIPLASTTPGPEPAPAVATKPGEAKLPQFGAAPQEWRTPPLWGVRDSAPYFHDGRAKTLEDAILAHGGQADGSKSEYVNLPFGKKRDLHRFLWSLAAPKGARTVR